MFSIMYQGSRLTKLIFTLYIEDISCVTLMASLIMEGIVKPMGLKLQGPLFQGLETI